MRRRATPLLLALALPASGCRAREGAPVPAPRSTVVADTSAARSPARLRARPGSPPADAALAPGAVHALPLGDGARDALLRVPRGYRPEHAAPLVVVLHGAGGAGDGMLRALADAADRTGTLLLAPQSANGTWDAIHDGFGRDVSRLDAALAATFARVAVDPARVTVAGFSDGATYALSLGLANGDLFARVVAFSPGFVVGAPAVGRPRIFVSHGTADRVLPIERCSRRIVPALQRAGYQVRYREFAGGHAMPPAIVDDAFVWDRASDE